MAQIQKNRPSMYSARGHRDPLCTQIKSNLLRIINPEPSPARRPRRVGITRKFASGVGEIPDGHRWDSPPKIRFAPDSPLEQRRSEPPVPLETESVFPAEQGSCPW